MNIIQRLAAPTSPFFRALRNIGLVLTAISAAILASPVQLPAMLVSIAGYLAVGGSVLAAVSQVTVDNGSSPPPDSASFHPGVPPADPFKGKGKGKRAESP